MHLSLLLGHGDPILAGVFLLLLLMSVASWTVIFWKAVILCRERAFLSRIRRDAPDWSRHQDIQEVQGCMLPIIEEARRVQRLPAESPSQRRELLTLHLSQCVETARAGLDRGLTLLASVGSSAPFIGLFGTVWGIYGALTRIAAEGNASLNVVAGPMGEALVATAIGLFAAIPAVLAYNGFVRFNRLLVQDIRHLAEQMAFYLSREEK